MYYSEKAIINKEAMEGLHDYCEKRNYKCKSCRYAIGKVTDKHHWTTECIFANCPCTWTEDNWN